MKESSSLSFLFDNPLNGVKLIETIQKYPCLYNNTLADYCKRDITERAWLAVSEQVNDTVDHCKRKWKNYRTCFLRKHKQETEDSLVDIRKRPYYLKEKMKFILPFIKANAQSAPDEFSVFEDGDYEEDEEDDNNDFEEAQKIIEVQPQPHQSVEEFTPINIKMENIPQISKKRKREDVAQVDPLAVAPQEAATDFDARKMFVLSLLPEIYELTDNQMKKFKRKVLELIDDISAQP